MTMRQTAICASHHQSALRLGFRDFVARTSLVVVVVLPLFDGWVGSFLFLFLLHLLHLCWLLLLQQLS
jgi:hypothetical protein